MITTLEAANRSKEWLLLHPIEGLSVHRPKGYGELPDEWADKLGRAEFGEYRVMMLEDVHLCGPALVGIIDGDIILDAGYYGRLDLWERNPPYFKWALEALDTPAQEVEAAISLGGCWSGNFYHWILETLPMLEGWERWQEEKNETLKVILPWNSHITGFMAHSISELAPNAVSCGMYADAKHYLVHRLLIAPSRRRAGYMASSSARWLSKQASNIKPGANARKIYISREYATTRRVVNEKELVKALIGEGFIVLHPENLTFREQVETFKGASIIVAAHGAGLANTAWCWPATRVVELVVPSYPNPCCWLAGLAFGMDWRYVIGEQRGKEDLHVDVNQVLKHIERDNDD